MKEIKGKIHNRVRDILIISGIYFAAHWFLLVATGIWGDDWAYADKNWEFLYEVMRQASVPLDAFLASITWIFPDGFYRIFVFLWYYFATLLFYGILRRTNYFDQNACLGISALFCIIPVNDARIEWINHNYAVGFVFFLLGVYIAVINIHNQSKRFYLFRLLSLFALFIGYSFLQSTMLFAIPLVCLLMFEKLKKDWDWKDKRNCCISFFRALVCHIDYLIEPVAWYFGDKILFPVNVDNAGVYYVKWDKLPSLLLSSPFYFYKTLRRMLSSYDLTLRSTKLTALLILLAILIYCLVMVLRHKKNNEISDEREKQYWLNCAMIFVGLCLCYIAYFPYIVKIGQACVLDNVYAGSRHTILLCIGMSIILYYTIDLVFSRYISTMVFLSVIVMGVVHFNNTYLDWQESYYQQVQIQHEISQNESIKNNNTFLVMLKNEVPVSVYPYRINGISWAATGKRSRLYLIGTSGLDRMNYIEDSSWYENGDIRDYKFDEKKLDGILFVEFQDIDRFSVLEQKKNELFSKRDFDLWIDTVKKIKYVDISQKQSDMIMEMHSAGSIEDKAIFDLFYP